MQLLLEAHEPLALFLGELAHGDAGGAADNLGDVIGGYLGRRTPTLAGLLEFGSQLVFAGPELVGVVLGGGGRRRWLQ